MQVSPVSWVTLIRCSTSPATTAVLEVASGSRYRAAQRSHQDATRPP